MFVTVSGDGNPDLVARAVRNIRQIRAHLSALSAGPIVEPLQTSEVRGRSFAIWPMLGQFPEGRVKRYLVKRALRQQVLDWLASLLIETKAETDAQERDAIARNLTRMAEDTKHPDSLRRAAAQANARLADGRWVPVTCVQHSDLWLGNIMIAPPGSPQPFSVIDWAGASSRGFPFFDLCRFAISSNAPSRLVATHVGRQRRILEADRADVVSYVLSALGQMQSDLEHFPEELFRSMASETTEFAQQFSQ